MGLVMHGPEASSREPAAGHGHSLTEGIVLVSVFITFHRWFP